MALKQLLIGKRISDLRAQLETLLQTRDNLVTRRAEMKRREEELEASVNEITEETSQEDRDALDALTQEWEGDDAALTQEENDNQQAREGIETQIAGLEQELSAINARMNAPAAQQRTEARKDETNMNTRKIFCGMNHQERDAFFAREDVTKFLGNVRAAIREKRTVTGTVRVAGGTAPVVSVRTSSPIPKEKVLELAALMGKLTVSAPVRPGDVLASGVLGTGSDLLATCAVAAK